MSQGFITLNRKILEWEWYQHKYVKSIFIHCLLMANHKDKKYQGTLIKRGEFLTSREKLSEQLGISESQVKTGLTHLKSTNELTIKSSRQGTRIIVNNYDNYQSDSRRVDQRLTNKSPTIDQRVASNNNDNTVNTVNTDNKFNIYSSAKAKLYGSEVKRVVDYLNQRTNKKFKQSTPKTQSLIVARLKEGFTLDDFQTVIDNKTIEWAGTDQEKYLRPCTLFGTKFESYLNQNESLEARKVEEAEQRIIDQLGDWGQDIV